jgi:hypothetical protein
LNQALRDTAFYRETQPGDVLRFARRILESRGGGSQGTGQGWYDRAQRNAVSDYGVRPFDRLLRELCQADGISLAAVLGENPEASLILDEIRRLV